MQEDLCPVRIGLMEAENLDREKENGVSTRTSVRVHAALVSSLRTHHYARAEYTRVRCVSRTSADRS